MENVKNIINNIFTIVSCEAKRLFIKRPLIKKVAAVLLVAGTLILATVTLGCVLDIAYKIGVYLIKKYWWCILIFMYIRKKKHN